MMKIAVKKRLKSFLTGCVAAAAMTLGLAPVSAAGDASAGTKPTLFIVGDSTVHNPTKGQCGWGDIIAPGFDASKITVKNVALGGRSSRSYIEEGLWQKRVLDELKPGDFVFVQFGHNDGGGFGNPKSAYRASLRGMSDEIKPWVDPKTNKTIDVHTFGYYMKQYVRDGKAKGATVVLLSLVPRNDWNKEGTAILRARPNGYAEWAQQAAEAEGGLFIDLNDISAKKFEAIGQANTSPKYFPVEHTHSSREGALINAQSVLDGLRALPNNPLAAYMKPGQLSAGETAEVQVKTDPHGPKDQPEAPPAK